MWVPRAELWNNNITSCEKFLAERIIQRCDYDEAISKKHRTINGFTQLQELIRLAELTKKRPRTIRTLIEIIKEAQSPYIKQNICNDLIINKYFIDLKKFISEYKTEEELKSENIDKVSHFLYQLNKFSQQLKKYYLRNLLYEFSQINYNENTKVQREFEKISELTDIIIPIFLYNGYSINSLNEVLRRWVENQYHITYSRFLNFFDHNNGIYEILIYIGNNETEINEFKSLVYPRGFGDIVEASKFNNDFSVSKAYTNRDKVIYYNTSIKDPVSFIRKEYEYLLRNLVISKDRKSLSIFTNFFKNSYWRKSDSGGKFFSKIKINSDPISVISRKSTLFRSLLESNSKDVFHEKSTLNFIKNEQIKKAVYYYNLGIGSKSIENSLSLMWTSLECIIPYRIFTSDIDNIKYLLAKCFSMGAFSRDIKYLIRRILVVSQVNDNCLSDIDLNKQPRYFCKDNAIEWIDWLKSDSNKKLDSFNKISPLLGFEYLQTIKPLTENSLDVILKRIKSSQYSIEFQLQRIYLHRNQIVHSGDYINEYTNLWIHLEWYVGKLLFYIINETEITKKYDTVERLFLNIESEYDYCFSYIEKNKKKAIADSEKIIGTLIEFDWQ